MNSQGPPRSGEFLQIWRNDKFQNWRNSPDLEKLQIFDQFFVMEESIVTSYNYSGTCIIYWRIKKMNFMPRQGTKKKVLRKNYFLPSKFPQIWRNSQDLRKFLNSYDFPPDLGKYPSFGAKSITKRPTQIAEVILEHSLLLLTTKCLTNIKLSLIWIILSILKCKGDLSIIQR